MASRAFVSAAILATPRGFEPRFSGPEPDVLPLDDEATSPQLARENHAVLTLTLRSVRELDREHVLEVRPKRAITARSGRHHGTRTRTLQLRKLALIRFSFVPILWDAVWIVPAHARLVIHRSLQRSLPAALRTMFASAFSESSRRSNNVSSSHPSFRKRARADTT